jgi:hypothetical protein
MSVIVVLRFTLTAYPFVVPAFDAFEFPALPPDESAPPGECVMLVGGQWEAVTVHSVPPHDQPLLLL